MSETPRTADEWFDVGSLAHQSLDFDAAIEAYLKAIKRDPDDPATLTAMGDLLFQRKDFAGAKPYFEKVWQTDPSYPEIQGYVYILLRPMREYPKVDVASGDAMVTVERFNEAVDFFRDSLVNARTGDQADLLYLTKLGLALIRLGRAGQTRSDLEEIRGVSTTYTFDEPLTPELLGEELVRIGDDASSGQDGTDFEQYLSVSDYRLFHELGFEWVRWRLIRRLWDHPEDTEARRLLSEIDGDDLPA